MSQNSDFFSRLPWLIFDMSKALVYFLILMNFVAVEITLQCVHWFRFKNTESNHYVRKFSAIESYLFKEIIFLLRWHNVPGLIYNFNTLLTLLLGNLLGCYRDGSYYSIVNVMIPDFSFAQGCTFPSSHAIVNCYFLMLCTKVSYESEDILRKVTCEDWNQGGANGDVVMKQFMYKLNNDFLSSFPRNKKIPPESFAFLRYDDKSVVVSFRGTEPLSILDWSSDFFAMPQDYTLSDGHSVVCIHTGFYDALTTVGPVYVNNVLGRRYSIFTSIVNHILMIPHLEKKKLFVSGHSLGGALATLFCFLLEQHNRELSRRIDCICTIGEPFVGDQRYTDEFNRIFKGRCYRFQFGSDIVTTDLLNVNHNITRFPPNLAGIPYRHHEGWHYINYEKAIKTEEDAVSLVAIDRNRGFLELRRMLINSNETWLRTVSRFVFPLIISDHFPDGYQVSLCAAALYAVTTNHNNNNNTDNTTNDRNHSKANTDGTANGAQSNLTKTVETARDKPDNKDEAPKEFSEGLTKEKLEEAKRNKQVLEAKLAKLKTERQKKK